MFQENLNYSNLEKKCLQELANCVTNEITTEEYSDIVAQIFKKLEQDEFLYSYKDIDRIITISFDKIYRYCEAKGHGKMRNLPAEDFMFLLEETIKKVSLFVSEKLPEKEIKNKINSELSTLQEKNWEKAKNKCLERERRHPVYTFIMKTFILITLTIFSLLSLAIIAGFVIFGLRIFLSAEDLFSHIWGLLMMAFGLGPIIIIAVYFIIKSNSSKKAESDD